MGERAIHVGLVGAGIGGLAAAIALRRAGAKVTVLEAAPVLGEVCATRCYPRNQIDVATDWRWHTNGSKYLINQFGSTKLKGLGRLPMSAASFEPGALRT